MPLYINKRCNVCTVIEAGDDDLLRRLYHSRHFLGPKGESIRQIAADYADKGLNQPGLHRHVQNHQAIAEGDVTQLHKDLVDKTAVRSALKEVIDHGTVRNLILTKGYKGIKSGKIKLKASDVRAASKDASDIEERAKDRNLQVMDMIMKVASGEVTSGVVSPTSNPGKTQTIIDLTA